MIKKHRALWIVAALSVVALVPLYGDPRRSPVTHSEWARMMMRSLGFEDNLKAIENADDIFTALAWKDQRNLVASEYKRGTAVTTRGDFVDTGTEIGETAYDLPVIRTGDYNIRLSLRGGPETPFQVEIRKDGQVDSVATFKPTGSGAEDYVSVDLGWVKLEPGNHTLSVILPPGTSLESIQISPPCLSPIEPLGGWRASALTSDEDLAVTMLQALDLESELPPADDPIEVRAGGFDILAPESRMTEGGTEGDDFQLTATFEGLHAIVYVDIPIAGLYTVTALTATGDGQTWIADSCRRADICPTPDATPKWRTLLTSEFNVGRHSFAVLLTNGASVGKIRLQRLKTAPEDYVAALERVGFRVGSKGPISRDKAREAMEWLRDRWKQKLGIDPSCVIQAPVGRVAGTPGQVAGGLTLTPGVVTPPGVTPPTQPPTGPPITPPLPPPLPPTTQPPATPVLPVR
ncbi:MAG TPA: hypothetical protein PLD86_13490 [Vicinamibacteria bacterium]|nr:hypothetical protein [Vicinamibacteria bacterium]